MRLAGGSVRGKLVTAVCTEGWRHLPFVAYIPHKLKVECGLWSVIEPLLMKFLHSRTASSHDSATFSRAQFS